MGIIEPSALPNQGNILFPQIGTPYDVGFLPNPVNSGNGYAGDQEIFALYAMTDAQINKKFRIIGGIRIENTDTQIVVDTSGINIPREINSKVKFDSAYVTDQLEFQWLPSVNFVYSPIDDMKFRLAYSKTLARPELNEITNSSQFDPIQQANVRGNNLVRNAGYENYDFRWDWFIRKGEILSASLFYKRIKRQLERVFIPEGDVTFNDFGLLPTIISFRNNPEDGELYGVEFEFRKNLDAITPVLKNFFMGTNCFFAYSETKFTDQELYIRRVVDRDAPDKRPLFDQPSFIVNFNLGYENEKWGSSYNIFINRTGDRLFEVNIDGTPDIYQRTPTDFDLIISQELLNRTTANPKLAGKKHQLTFTAFVKNLLRQESRFIYKNGNRLTETTYGENNQTYVRRGFRRGLEVACGFKYIF